MNNNFEVAITEFTEQIGFIVFFLISCLLISLFFDRKILYGFLVLVFAGEILANARKISTLYGKVVGK